MLPVTGGRFDQANQQCSEGGLGEMGTAIVQGTPHPDQRPVAPDRSLLQRMEALQRANDVRSARARLKRDLKAGRQPVHELLLYPPEFIETAKVFDLLMAAPKLGRVKVSKILSRCGISPSKTIGGLSSRQRRELARALETMPWWLR